MDEPRRSRRWPTWVPLGSFLLIAAALVATWRTVSAREEESRALRVETAAEGVWEIDADLHTTFVNRRMAEMLGYEPDEMIGRHIFDFATAEWNEYAREQLELRRAGHVEDDDAVRGVIVRALEDVGYRVLQADSGEAAAALLAGGRAVDVLLTDVVMPGMDGPELATLLRKPLRLEELAQVVAAAVPTRAAT